MELTLLVNSRDEDAELIRKCRSGDEWAFEMLVKKYQQTVFNLIYHFAGGIQETEDIAQKVFAKVYFSLGKFNLNRPFYPWLCRITINQCYDDLRHWQRRKTVVFSELERDETASAEKILHERSQAQAAPEKEHIRNVVHKVLASLPRDYRTVLILREIEELSYEEIAGIIECSVPAARLRVFRARMKMRKALERMVKQHKITL
jgi:RNA polymerase sigma-70 factor (ECF subfamily)